MNSDHGMVVTRLGLFERLLNSLYQSGVLGFLGLFTLLVFTTTVSHDQSHVFESQVYNVAFDQFSPAFAAFEDEYIFEKNEGEFLKSGKSSKQWTHLTRPETTPTPTLQIIAKEESEPQSGFLAQFDGGVLVREIQKTVLKLNRRPKPTKDLPKTASTKIHSEELKFGALATLVTPSTPSINPMAIPRPQFDQNPGYYPKQNTIRPNDLEPKEVSVPRKYKISGAIELKEGLAFLGSMEISWVVGDNELQVGSINVPDATFEIEVNQLVGDIVLSLYDNKDELIGEGIFDLTTLPIKESKVSALMEVYPIDWDTAGEIVHSESLGAIGEKRVEGASVALYAFNEATLSKSNGIFSFYNWKKTNSRTLAIASKTGFMDSIFMLDSKKYAKIALFTESYIKSLFSYLENLGVHDVKDMGMIYGEIAGLDDKSGFRVYLEDQKPIYFEYGLATLEKKTTTANGLFAFVGLQDGDYKVLIEKAGEIVDEKLVVVEQGKVSPIRVDLGQLQKHLEFFDPLKPDYPIRKVDIGFFDGIKSLDLDLETPTFIPIKNGSDPGLVHFNTEPFESHTFISKNKELQKVPYLKDKTLFELAKSNDLELNSGLIFGFVDSSIPYQVALIESPVEKLIYFDEKGQWIENPKEEIPFGFIMGGFPQGLSSIVVESLEDQTVLGTDLVFSNHESVSIILMDILPLN